MKTIDPQLAWIVKSKNLAKKGVKVYRWCKMMTRIPMEENVNVA